MTKKQPPLAKITWADVKEIRTSNETIPELSKRFSLSTSQVYRILANTHWFDPDYTPRKRKQGPKNHKNSIAKQPSQLTISLKIEEVPTEKGLWAMLKSWLAKTCAKLTKTNDHH